MATSSIAARRRRAATSLGEFDLRLFASSEEDDADDEAGSPPRTPTTPDRHSSNNKRKERKSTVTTLGDDEDGDGSSSSSSSSDTDSSNSDSESVVSLPPALDGGWGWVIVAASFFAHFVVDGLAYSCGIVYEQVRAYFNATASRASPVSSVYNALPYALGPLSGAIVNRFGCRKSCIAGALLGFIGCFISYFTNSIEGVIFAYSVLFGYGQGLVLMASTVIVPYYFDRKRSLAYGIAVSGSGLGATVWPFILDYLAKEYVWNGMLLIVGAFTLNLLAVGWLYRPLITTEYKRQYKRNKNLEKFELEYRENKNREAARKRRRDLRVVRLRETTTYVIKGGEDEQMEVVTDVEQQLVSNTGIRRRKNPCKSLKLVPIAGSQRVIPPLSKTDIFHKSSVTSAASSREARMQALASTLRPPRNIIVLTTPVNHKKDPSSSPVATDHPITEGPVVDTSDTLATENTNVASYNSPKFPRNLTSVLDGIPESLDVHMVQSCPDLHPILRRHLNSADQPTIANGTALAAVTMTTTGARQQRHTEDPQLLRKIKTAQASIRWAKKGGHRVCHGLLDVLKSMLSFKLLRRPVFIWFFLSNMIFYSWFEVPLTFLHEYADNVLEVPHAASILSVLGLVTCVAQIVLGRIEGKPWYRNSIFLYAIGLMLCGLVTLIMLPRVRSLPGLLAYAGIFSLGTCGNTALDTIILTELLGIRRLTRSYGLLMVAQGLGSVIGPIISGKIIDLKTVEARRLLYDEKFNSTAVSDDTISAWFRENNIKVRLSPDAYYEVWLYTGGWLIFSGAMVLIVLPFRSFFRHWDPLKKVPSKTKRVLRETCKCGCASLASSSSSSSSSEDEGDDKVETPPRQPPPRIATTRLKNANGRPPIDDQTNNNDGAVQETKVGFHSIGV